MSDQRQHEVTGDLYALLKAGQEVVGASMSVAYTFDLYENEDGTKFIGIEVDGHIADIDRLSEWSIQPERS